MFLTSGIRKKVVAAGVALAIMLTSCTAEKKGFIKQKAIPEPPKVKIVNNKVDGEKSIYDYIKCWLCENDRVCVELADFPYNGEKWNMKGSFDPTLYDFTFLGSNEKINEAGCIDSAFVAVTDKNIVYIPYDKVSLLLMAITNTENDWMKRILLSNYSIPNVKKMVLDEKNDVAYVLSHTGTILVVQFYNVKNGNSKTYVEKNYIGQVADIHLRKDGLVLKNGDGKVVSIIKYLYNPYSREFERDVINSGDAPNISSTP